MSDDIGVHISPFLLELSQEVVKLRENQKSITQALKEDFDRRLSHLDTRVSACEQAASTKQCETSNSQLSEIENTTAKLDGHVFDDATGGNGSSSGESACEQAASTRQCETSNSQLSEIKNTTAKLDGNVFDDATEGMEAVQESASTLCSKAESRAKGTRSYAVEANVYGLLVMPGRPLGSGSWLLLLLHYLVVFWLSHAIDEATVRAVDDLMGEIDGKLCMKVGDSWDCAEPLLKQMTDFTSLDRNKDGLWTMQEAGAAGLLSQFQAVHDVAVESADILRVLVPPVSEVPDSFCSLALEAFGQYAPAIGWEESVSQILKYLRSKGIDVEFALETSLPDIGRCKQRVVDHYGNVEVYFEDRRVYFQDAFCMAQHMCQIYLKGIPAQGSKDVYRRYTVYYSFFPDWIYEFLIKNLLQPCLLLDGDMCANAEIDSDFLRMVPRWRELGSADRVEQCKSYVDEFCPRILGDQFRTFAKDVSESCGTRKYETETVVSDVTASRGSLLNDVNHKDLCKDNDSAIGTLFPQIAAENVFFHQFNELLVSRGLMMHTCEQLKISGWCDLRMPVTRKRADGTLENIMFGALLGEACPQTCCDDTFYEDEPMLNFTPIGCNPLCHHAGEHNDHAAAIRYKCFGSGCNRIWFQVEQFGQLRISARAGWYDGEESSMITIYSNRSLQVNVINVFAGGGLDCPRDFLRLDGAKVCNENLWTNQQVFVPLKSRDSFDIFFYASASSRCPSGATKNSSECNWELIIVDAGERKEATISKLIFKQQIRFGTGPQGVRSFEYISFFFLILLVWVSFMWQELIRIAELAFFLCECADFESRRNRVCFFFCVVLPRLVIWVWVLRVGLSLLLASSEFVEIVLNSVALGFILDVDEILFVVMVPSYVQEALLCLDPIRWKKTLPSGKILGNAEVFLGSFGLSLLIAGIVSWEYYKRGGYLETAGQVDCLCDLRGAYCSSGVLH